MKIAWNFGGSEKEFSQTILKGFDKVIKFSRNNVDYADVEKFLENISEYPVPDLIFFNIANNGHYVDLDKKFTPREDINKLFEIIDSTFYFQLRVIEWFFSNFKNKRVLFSTSMECMSIIQEDDYPDSDIFDDGDLLLYRMSRALEHQIIHTQNVLKRNHDNNNIIMGFCVGLNLPGTAEMIYNMIKTDSFYRNIFTVNENTITHGFSSYPTLFHEEQPFEHISTLHEKDIN